MMKINIKQYGSESRLYIQRGQCEWIIEKIAEKRHQQATEQQAITTTNPKHFIFQQTNKGLPVVGLIYNVYGQYAPV